MTDRQPFSHTIDLQDIPESAKSLTISLSEHGHALTVTMSWTDESKQIIRKTYCGFPTQKVVYERRQSSDA